jgi:hypothetical protein
MKGKDKKVDAKTVTYLENKIQRSTSAVKRLYTLKEAARYLGRSEWGMRELIWSKKIPVVREVRKIYLDINDLEEYVNRNKSLYD